MSPYIAFNDNPINLVDVDGQAAGDPPNNDGNTKVEKSTASKVFDIAQHGVEEFFNGIVFTTTLAVASVGNTTKGFAKRANRIGLLKTLDGGSTDVLSDKEKYTPLSFSFKAKYLITQKGNEQHEGTNEGMSYEHGKTVIKGTVTLSTLGLGLGIKGFIGKTIFGQGLEGLGKTAAPKETKTPELHLSVTFHVTPEPVVQTSGNTVSAPSSGDVPQK